MNATSGARADAKIERYLVVRAMTGSEWRGPDWVFRSPEGRARPSGHWRRDVWLEREVRTNALLGLIGATRVRELEEARAVLNRPECGGWGVLFMPWKGWVAVRGRREIVWASNPFQLRDQIVPLRVAG